MNVSYIVAPAVGALIGYITNFIAIKMLFRPLKPILFLGFKVPFTPGIIPREKARLAKSIGVAVGDQLLTQDTLTDILLSPHFQHQIESFIDEKLLDIRTENLKLSSYGEYLFEAENWYAFTDTLQESISIFLHAKLNSPEVIHKLTVYLSHSLDELIEKQFTNPMFKMILTINKGMLDSVKNSIISKIKDLLLNDSQETLHVLVKEEMQQFLASPSGDLICQWEEELQEIRKLLIKAFNRMVCDHMDTMMSALDISTAVEKRINDYDVEEVESLILSVIDKELKAIIWLGAFLGLLMGFIVPLVA